MSAAAKQSYTFKLQPEASGSWLAEVVEVPGVSVHGQTPEEAATAAVSALFRVLEEQQQDVDDAATRRERANEPSEPWQDVKAELGLE
jgi:predicted RNase H-like HicB family nuclease